MLCNECGMREATVHTVRIVNGVKTESYLCPECAAKQGTMIFSASDFLKGFFDHKEEKKAAVCSNCGMSVGDFRRTGLLGCSECYNEFKGEVIPVLRKVHGAVSHAHGEAPRKKEPSRLEVLKKELDEAIKKEEFERAAQLRDEINALKEAKND